MRRVFGGILLIAGVGGLGWFATTNNAERIQSVITQAAQGIAAEGVHGVKAEVSGRDITVTGTSEAGELDDLIAKFDGIEGRRIVNTDDLALLPVVDPFELNASLIGDASQADGYIPLEATREALRPLLGDAVDNLTLADGEPDAAWNTVAVDTLAALPLLEEGGFRLSGTDLTIDGLAKTPTESAAFEDALVIPDNYSVTTEIDLLDDGTPMFLDLAYEDGALSGTGKVPADFDLANTRFPGSENTTEITQSKVQSDWADWNELADFGVMSLDIFDAGEGAGTLSITDESYVLTGVVRRPQADIDTDAGRIRSGVVTIAPDYDVDISITPFDDGEPFSLNATFNGNNVIADGKLPYNASDDLDPQFQYLLSSPDLDVAFINDGTDTWPAIVNAGLTALVTLEEGTLSIENDEITLTGTALSPLSFEAAKAAMAGFSNTDEVAFIDDGQPVGIEVTYSNDVANLSGKLPADLDASDVSDVLGFEVTSEGANASNIPSTANLLAPLEGIVGSLPDINALTFTNGPDGAQINAVAAPGVDAVQLADELTTQLDGAVALSINPATDVPEAGALRTNRFTGQTEIFASGFWLPTYNFESSIATCTAESDAILAENNVRFVTGSAQLDVQSIRAINALAALARKCAFEAGLFLQVDGHTDSVGDADANLALSQERADAVRAAILERGVAQGAVGATGFGDSQPIADNETDEGRAANRRTAFSWVFE